MSTAQRVAELEREKAELRTRLELTAARLGAVDHELKLLRQAVSSGEELSEMKLTDAVVTALRASGAILSPSELETRLSAGGRTEPLNNITATLNYLVKQGRVTRQGRGKYLAV